MNQEKRLYIVGQSGSGKALIAKTVAEKLGWQFIDADFDLEFRIGLNINEILGKEGAQFFYQCQTQMLAAQSSREDIVVTTDASIVCCKHNRELLSDSLVVYLKVSPPIQEERTTRTPAALLPILNIKNFLIKQHQQRDHWYEQIADLTINSDENDLENHVMTIIELVNKKHDDKPNTIKIVYDKNNIDPS